MPVRRLLLQPALHCLLSNTPYLSMCPPQPAATAAADISSCTGCAATQLPNNPQGPSPHKGCCIPHQTSWGYCTAMPLRLLGGCSLLSLSHLSGHQADPVQRKLSPYKRPQKLYCLEANQELQPFSFSFNVFELLVLFSNFEALLACILMCLTESIFSLNAFWKLFLRLFLGLLPRIFTHNIPQFMVSPFLSLWSL